MMSFPSLSFLRVKCHSLLLLLSLVVTIQVAAVVHNGSFIPDGVLRVTAQNISVGGIQRFSVVVNGSSPGPEIRVPEGEVAWIRVYNDMGSQNLTMVGRTVKQTVIRSRC